VLSRLANKRSRTGKRATPGHTSEFQNATFHFVVLNECALPSETQLLVLSTYHARLLEVLRQKSISPEAQGVYFCVTYICTLGKSFRTSNSLAWEDNIVSTLWREASAENRRGRDEEEGEDNYQVNPRPLTG
jgi:hypothetical protein